MDTKEIWKKTCTSICQIFHRKEGKIIGVGTGFKSSGFIITNNHVYNPINSDEITISFKESNGINVTLSKKYTAEEFIKILNRGMPQGSWDFAVLNDSFFDKIPDLKLSSVESVTEIGQDCVFLGFPLSSNYLSIHKAIVSAKYTNTKNEVKYIQLDASINKGNSGGPLINSETLEVIGIVTLKKTGFSERFEALNKSYQNNLNHFEQNKGMKIQMGNYEIGDALKVIQNQLKELSQEIERANNVGIGFAFELDEVREALL